MGRITLYKYNMKKIFVDVRTGKQVSLGQPYDIQFTGPQGSMRLAGDQMNKSVLSLLIACGAVTEEEVSEEKKERSIYGNLGGVPDNAGFYISQAGKKLGIDPLSACELLEMVAIMNPTAFFSILLREVAVELDKKYPDHIENSKEIYYINVFNGTITKADKAWIRNYRNFAAFRTVEDARVACKILSPIMKDLFKRK